MKNICPNTGQVCNPDCILFTKHLVKDEVSKEEYPAFCGKYGVRFPVEEVTIDG